MEEIKRGIREIITEKFKLNRPLEELKDDTQLFRSEGLSLNSIQGLELLVGIEMKFDIEFDEDDSLVELFENINTLAGYVENKLTGQQVG